MAFGLDPFFAGVVLTPIFVICLDVLEIRFPKPIAPNLAFGLALGLVPIATVVVSIFDAMGWTIAAVATCTLTVSLVVELMAQRGRYKHSREI